MPFSLRQAKEAEGPLDALRRDRAQLKRWKAVRKCLRLLAADPRHPGLHTYEYHSLSGLKGEKVFEAHAENKTPGAYRVFWHYGPGKSEITIVAITPHP